MNLVNGLVAIFLIAISTPLAVEVFTSPELNQAIASAVSAQVAALTKQSEARTIAILAKHEAR